MIAFEGGPESEMAYVRDAITQTFVDYLGSEPRRDDPEAWFGSTADKSQAEALAAALVAVDSQPRDPNLEIVHQVHVH